jgi:hypothetical protein
MDNSATALQALAQSPGLAELQDVIGALRGIVELGTLARDPLSP